MAINIDRVVIYNENFSSKNYTALWSRGLARLCEILDLLYLCYNKSYGGQFWQCGDFLWEASTHQFTQLFEYVATWGNVINWKHYLHCHNAYGHRTWWGCHIQWEASLHKVRGQVVIYATTWAIFKLKLKKKQQKNKKLLFTVCSNIQFCNSFFVTYGTPCHTRGHHSHFPFNPYLGSRRFPYG